MRICIAGDSWGCGEWGFTSRGGYAPIHPGLEGYLRDDGHEVTNLSVPGCSNRDVHQRLSDIGLDRFDITICFVTDPLRDYRDVGYTGILKTADSIRAAHESALHEHYDRLDALGHGILLLGGTCRVDHDLPRHVNLSSLIPSVIEFLCPHIRHPQIWMSEWIYHVNTRNCDTSAIEYIHEQKRLQDRLHDHADDGLVDRYFNPDGRHPNRNGHRMIFEKIRESCI